MSKLTDEQKIERAKQRAEQRERMRLLRLEIRRMNAAIDAGDLKKAHGHSHSIEGQIARLTRNA
jgi:hypothetical protein